MAFDVPPLLAEVVLSGPEVVAVERALAAVVEKSGLSADDLALATDLASLDLLSAVYARWEQQVRRLDSSSCGLSVDGHGLLVVNVSVPDVQALVMALKARLVDISIQTSDEDDEGYSDQEFKLVAKLIAWFEALL
jgi:hypothetical protein